MVFLCVFNSANKKHIFSQTHFDEGSSSWSSFGRASLGGFGVEHVEFMVQFWDQNEEDTLRFV